MQTGLRAVGWSLQRLGILLVGLAVGLCLLYVMWVLLIIAGMAFSGQ